MTMRYQLFLRHSLLGLLAIFALGACASNPTHSSAITIAKARTQATQLKGKQVHWGGTILSVKNAQKHSLIEVLGRPLSGSEPNDLKKAQGRFMIRLSGFVDPAEYKSPSRITVTGHLSGVTQGKVGNYPYTYPLVIAKSYKLWPGKTRQQTYDPVPWWWDRPYYGHRSRWPGYWW
jgi:outer membrane lipoprotein